MERDYRGWCEALVALEVVNLDDREGRPLVVEVCLVGRPRCGGCGGGVWVKEKRRVVVGECSRRFGGGRRAWCGGNAGGGVRVLSARWPRSPSRPRATPAGKSARAWHAKETVRQIYQTPDPADADAFVRLLAQDLQHESCPPELNQLGKTLHTWHPQIVAWYQARVTNAPIEAVNNLIKRVKRAAFGFRNYRTRALLYASKPNPNLLPTLTPP